MFILLCIFWLLLMGGVTIEYVVIGALVSAAIYLLMYKLFGITPVKELKLIPLLWYIPAYAAAIFVEVIKADITVLSMAFSPSKHPDPTIVKKHFSLKTDLARAVLANSITLTPGTITLEVTDDVFTIHVLSASQAAGLDNWIIYRLLAKAERSIIHDARKA